MQPLVFSKDLTTGDEVVDAHHRALFAAANDLLFAHDVREDPALFLRGLAFLARYVRFHFAAEEAAMERLGYGALEGHRKHHQDLARRIDLLGALAGEDGPSPRLREALHTLMRDWIGVHVLVLDKDFVQHSRRRDQPVVVASDEAAAGDLGPVTAGPAGEDDGGLVSRLRRFWK